MITECCGMPIGPDERFCPWCGWEARADLRCPDCGQPVDILTGRTYPVTNPDTGKTLMHAEAIRYCPSAFHFKPHA
jgi:hypothetical protein